MLVDEPTRNSQSGRSWPMLSPYLTLAIHYGLMLFAFFVMFAKLNHLVEYLFFGLVGIWIIREIGSRSFRFVRTPFDVPLVLFLVWVLIGVATAPDPAYSFVEWRKTLAKVLMLYFVVHAVTEERPVRQIVLAFIGGACVHSLIGIIHFVTEGNQVFTMSVRAAGWTSASMWLSTYVVMSLPFLWLGATDTSSARRRGLYAVGSCLALAALFLALTRGAWVALAAQVIVFVTARSTRNGLMTAGVAVLFLSGFFAALALLGPLQGVLQQGEFTDMTTMAIRFKTWGIAVRDIMAHPLTGLGYGLDTFSMVHPDAQEHRYHTHVHNTFLGRAVHTGIPGFLLFCWIFVAILNTAFRSWKRMPDQYAGRLALAVLLTTVGVMVRNLFDDMFLGTLEYLFWLLVGLMWTQLKPQDRQATRPGSLEGRDRPLVTDG